MELWSCKQQDSKHERQQTSENTEASGPACFSHSPVKKRTTYVDPTTIIFLPAKPTNKMKSPMTSDGMATARGSLIILETSDSAWASRELLRPGLAAEDCLSMWEQVVEAPTKGQPYHWHIGKHYAPPLRTIFCHDGSSFLGPQREGFLLHVEVCLIGPWGGTVWNLVALYCWWEFGLVQYTRSPSESDLIVVVLNLNELGLWFWAHLLRKSSFGF